MDSVSRSGDAGRGRRWVRRLSGVSTPFSRRSAAVALVVVVALVSAGCSGGDGSSDSDGDSNSSAPKPDLRVGLTSIASGFAPFDFVDTGHVGGLVYEGFFEMTADGTYAPGLATDIHFLAPKGDRLRNQVFDLTLRKGVMFSDGTPLNAEAVKTWFDYTAKNSPNAATYMGTVESVETLDEWTVRVRLAAPNPAVPYALTGINAGYGSVSSPACVEDPSLFKKQSCGAGPYQLDYSKSVLGDHYTMVPNPNYFDKSRQQWSSVTVKAIPSASSMLQAVQTGEIDIAEGDTATASNAEAAGFGIVHAPSFNVVLIPDLTGTKSKPLADVRVRQAMNYAIDRSTIATTFGGDGNYLTATSEIGTWGGGINPDYTDYYDYDPDKARQLLAEAGYSEGFTVDLLTYGPFGRAGTPLMQAVAQNLADVGITAKITPATSLGEWADSFSKYPLFQGPYGFDFMTVYHAIFLGDGSALNGGDAKIEAQFSAGIQAEDPTPYWQEISAQATKEAYFVPVAYLDRIYYVDEDKVSGVQITEERPRLDPFEWTAS